MAANDQRERTERAPFIAPPAQSALFVSPVGSDANAGTIEAPLRTIAAAADRVVSGGTIYLRAGTYEEGMPYLPDGVDGSHKTTLEAYNGETVTLLKPWRGQSVGRITNRTNIKLKDLSLDGSYVTLEILKVSGSTNIDLIGLDCANITKTGSDPVQGILVSGGSSNILIDHCKAHGVRGDGFCHGLYLSSVGGVTVTGGEYYQNSGHGIHANGLNDAAAYTLDHPYCHDNGEIGIGLYYGNATVINAVCRGNGYANLRAIYALVSAEINFATCSDPGENNYVLGEPNEGYAPAVALKNCLALGGVNGVYIGNHSGTPLPAGTDIQLTNSLCSGQSGGTVEIALPDATGITQTGVITDQEFTPISDDGAAGIKPGSGNPSIGAGVAVEGVTTDYGGDARANPPTIGAWE